MRRKTGDTGIQGFALMIATALSVCKKSLQQVCSCPPMDIYSDEQIAAWISSSSKILAEALSRRGVRGDGSEEKHWLAATHSYSCCNKENGLLLWLIFLPWWKIPLEPRTPAVEKRNDENGKNKGVNFRYRDIWVCLNFFPYIFFILPWRFGWKNYDRGRA